MEKSGSWMPVTVEANSKKLKSQVIYYKIVAFQYRRRFRAAPAQARY
jgi:hypothetical protein